MVASPSFWAVVRPAHPPLPLVTSVGPNEAANRNDGIEATGDAADAALVCAARAGDAKAQRGIWTKYAALVRSKMRRSVGAHDLDDMVQEVFMRLFECLPHLRDPAALRSFLIGITLRVAGTELRRRGSRAWLRLTPTGDLPEERAPARPHDGEAHQALARFDGILGKLGAHGRRVFELRHVEDRDLVDVAAAMHVSLATAKRHLARASTRVFSMCEREPALCGYV